MEPEKQIIPIDKNHTYMIAKYGPVIKHTTDDGKIIFLKVKEDISIEILKTGGYALEDIIVSKKLDDSPNERVIGDHNGKTVVLKNGRYGLYLEWNTQKINIPIEPDEFDAVTMVDILEYLVNPIITQITKDISLRNGKFGPYIYYKTAKMKKPKFLPLDKSITKESSVQDITEWLFVKHQIKI
jgi:DNA topoisomerase-1